MTPIRATLQLSVHAMVAQQTHIQVKCLHECHMSCMKCHHAHIPSHSSTPTHMHMPNVKTVTGITNDPCIEPSLAHQYPMQVPMDNESRVNSDSYHTTRSLCDKHDRVSSLGNRTFRITPVSYTHVTELFGSHRGSLTLMFQAFHLRVLTVPFLLCPTHIIYIYFYVLTRETSIGRHSKYELTTHLSTFMMNDHIHAHTPSMLISLCICNANFTANSHVTCMMHTTWNILINRTSYQVPCNIYRKHISSIHFMPIFIDIVVSCILAFINT